MQLRNGKVIGHQIQDDQCSICIDIKYKPVRLSPCGHQFCDPCVRKLRNERCPICSEKIENCSHVHDLGAKLEEDYPNEYKERRMAEDLYNVTLTLPRRKSLCESILPVLLDLIINLPLFAIILALIGLQFILRLVKILTEIGMIILITQLLHYINTGILLAIAPPLTEMWVILQQLEILTENRTDFFGEIYQDEAYSHFKNVVLISGHTTMIVLLLLGSTGYLNQMELLYSKSLLNWGY